MRTGKTGSCRYPQLVLAVVPIGQAEPRVAAAPLVGRKAHQVNLASRPSVGKIDIDGNPAIGLPLW